MAYLVATPICPGCYNLLEYNAMPDIGETYWHCKPCQMWWMTDFLIQCLEEEELYEYLSKEEANDEES